MSILQGRINKIQKRNFLLILSVTLLSIIGVTTITPVLPTIREALNISPQKIGLLITVFTLPGAALAPVVGIITDRFGRKRVLIPALLIFGISGTLCFFTRDFEILLILRFFQGLGAACLGILNITLIGDTFTNENRIKIMGYNSSAISVATALYPAVGGLLAAFGWYYPFLLPSLGIILAVLIFFYLDNPEPVQNLSFKNYFRKALKLVFNKDSLIFFILNMFTFILLFGVILTYLPLLLQEEYGMKSKLIGVIISFLSISSGITASQLKRISKFMSLKSMIIAGFATYVTGFFAIPFTENLYVLIILLFIVGLGQGINLPTIYHVLTSSVPLNHRGAFMSVNSMMTRTGQTLGPLFAGFVVAISNIKWVFWGGGIAAFIFLLVIIVIIPKNQKF